MCTRAGKDDCTKSAKGFNNHSKKEGSNPLIIDKLRIYEDYLLRDTCVK